MTCFSRFVSFAILALMFSSAATAWAGDPKADEPVRGTATPNVDLTYSPQWPEPPDTGAMLLRLGVGTVIVLGLCVGSLWIGKPWLQRLQAGNVGGQALHVEGSVSLGHRAVLYLVKVGDAQLIAGTDAAGLKSLLALPASFKEVLDEQLPRAEVASVAQAPHFGMRTDVAARSKE